MFQIFNYRSYNRIECFDDWMFAGVWCRGGRVPLIEGPSLRRDGPCVWPLHSLCLIKQMRRSSEDTGQSIAYPSLLICRRKLNGSVLLSWEAHSYHWALLVVALRFQTHESVNISSLVYDLVRITIIVQRVGWLKFLGCQWINGGVKTYNQTFNQ